ncbi:AAA family ATPase [Vairimorpha necatrix]|uniref:AAA family ATPase n=1 Tax=Vairimorpha necatrix TaxID=6039 RepID=A0AAX4JAV5_9MICR
MEIEDCGQKDSEKIIYVSNNIPKKSAMESISLIVGIISSILNIFLTCLFLFIVPIIFNALRNAGDKNNKNNEFDFFTAKDFANVKYHGREKLFEKITNNIFEIIQLTEHKSAAEVSDKITVIDRNLLLWGPAGTGKTHFIKKLIFLLNEKIKKKTEQSGKKVTKIQEKTKGYKDKTKHEDGEYVRAYFITPSMLEDKYKGETEKKINKLFEEARDDTKWKATFIFIDEIDSFFANREFSHQDHSSKSKTEFLNLLSGIKEDIMKNVFFVGASNFMSVIDDAFLRRFGQKIEFKLPNGNETYEMLKSITRDWTQEQNRDDYLRHIAEILSKRSCSQSFISELCKRMTWKDAHKKPGAIGRFRIIVLAADEKRQANINNMSTPKSSESFRQYYQTKEKSEKFDHSDFDFELEEEDSSNVETKE